MSDARFWVMSKAELQFLANCEIQQAELISVSFGISSGCICLLHPAGFVRMGKKFGITKATFLHGGRDQPRFRYNSVEFACVCSEADLANVEAEFELECSHLNWTSN